MNEKTHFNECYQCKFKRNIPGDTHIQCIKPDSEINGHPHGIRNGWFIYPINFDPVWKTNNCKNFEEKESL